MKTIKRPYHLTCEDCIYENNNKKCSKVICYADGKSPLRKRKK